MHLTRLDLYHYTIIFLMGYERQVSILFEVGAIIIVMIETLNEVLTGPCRLNRADRLLIGVSGGADSLALLIALAADGWDVHAAHFNHRLRDNAEQDSEFVQTFCQKHAIPCVIGSGETPTFADEQRLNVEEAARRLRYRFLFEVGAAKKTAAVVTAHQADDQVETVLLHLLRGTGLDGLTGMGYRTLTEWHPHIPLVRPMLDVWREEIDAYCAQRGLTPQVDPSNLDTGYRRNQIRLETIPALEAVEPNFKANLLRMVEVLRGDQSLLDAITRRVWEEVLVRAGEDEIALDRLIFLEQSLGMQRRLLRRAFSHFQPGLTDISFEAVERARLLIQSPPASNQSDLFQGLQLSIQGGQAVVSRWTAEEDLQLNWPQLGDETHVLLPRQGSVLLPNGWMVSLEELDRKMLDFDKIQKNPDPYTAYLDTAAISHGLVLRARQDGDRYQPLGMAGQSVKLSDLMVNTKLPRQARERYPLVCVGEKIVWVPGVQPAEFVRVTEDSRQVLKIRLRSNQ